jgi:signal transduction histidine kinase
LLIAQKSAIIILDPLPAINAVPIQMQQLFYNLLNNALKFSNKDVAPVVRIHARKMNEEELMRMPNLSKLNDWYQFTVKDNDIGFEQQYEEKIFSIFQRLHTRKEFEGTGIGLSLVKKVVSNHGGEIRAYSNPGEGATFQFLLPSLLASG